MSMTKSARDLGLSDLRYDVEVTGWEVGETRTSRRRWVGMLLAVAGEKPSPNYGEVDIALACGAAPIRLTVDADSIVTIDRTEKRQPVHFGGCLMPPVLTRREAKLVRLVQLRLDTAWTASAADREGFKCIAHAQWRKVERLDRKIDRLNKKVNK